VQPQDSLPCSRKHYYCIIFIYIKHFLFVCWILIFLLMNLFTLWASVFFVFGVRSVSAKQETNEHLLLQQVCVLHIYGTSLIFNQLSRIAREGSIKWHIFVTKCLGSLTRIRTWQNRYTTVTVHKELRLLFWFVTPFILNWLGNLKGRDHLEDLNVDEKIILDWILWKTGWEGVDWIHLAQDRDQWQALVNTIMDRRIP
jgi:hypothetical protein